MLSRVTIAAMLVALGGTCATAAPAGCWDGRYYYRALVVGEAVGPQTEIEGNFTTLLAGRGSFAPEWVRVVVVGEGGAVLAPARWETLPGYDATSAAVGRIAARLSTEGPVYVYFDVADNGPFGPGPLLAPGARGNELLADGGFETLRADDTPWSEWASMFSVDTITRSGAKRETSSASIPSSSACTGS